MECDTRIPPSRRPIAVEDYQAGDESSYSVSIPLGDPGELLSQIHRLHLSPCNVAFATQPVWAQNPDSQPSKVYPFHNYSSATYVLNSCKISKGNQPDFKNVSASVFPC